MPLRWLRELLVAVANLLEAEGRALRRSSLKLVIALAGLLGASVLALAGAGLMVAALVVALDTVMATGWALLLVGLVMFALAGVGAWMMVRLAK